MKIKSFAAALIILTFSSLVFAQTKEPLFSFSFEPEFGILYGQITENVWFVKETRTPAATTYTATTRMSRLDWEIENKAYVGANVNMTFNNRVSFDLNFKTAKAGECGAMEDYDWLNTVTKKWKDDPPDELTNYSVHTNVLSDYSKLRFSAGYNFYPGKKETVCITPKFGVQSFRAYFSGIGGYYIYKENAFQTLSFNQNATVITYTQSYTAPMASLCVNALFFDFLETGADINGVYIKKMNAYDDHVEKHNTYSECYFNDVLQNVWIFNAELSLLCRITKHNKLGIKGGVTFSPDSYGFTYSSSESFEKLSKKPAYGLGGTSKLMFNFALAYSFFF